MNRWFPVLLGSILGLVLGLGIVANWPTWLNRAATITALVSASLALSINGGKVFTSGLCTGLALGVFEIGLVLALWNNYAINNEDVVRYFRESGLSWDLKPLVLLALLPVSIIWALAIGSVSWMFNGLIRYFSRQNGR
jgi:hypothetical protein